MWPFDEFYLKNHLGSTVAVMDNGAVSALKAVYDYRAFAEQVDLQQKGDKVTENFTGKEKDDETALNYFGARYLDPMLGMLLIFRKMEIILFFLPKELNLRLFLFLVKRRER